MQVSVCEGMDECGKVGEGKDPALRPVTTRVEMLCHSLLADHIPARGQRWSPGFVLGTLMRVEECPEDVT